MGITGVEHLEDRAKVKYHLRRIWGEKDEIGSEDVLYNQVPNLPTMRELESSAGAWETAEEINLRKIGKTIIFIIEHFVEKAAEPAEEYLHGPYLKK